MKKPMMRPSGAGRAVNCHGSVKAEFNYPDIETEETRDGTAAHWLFAEWLNNRSAGVGDTAENGVIITKEMCSAAEMFVDHIRETINRHDGISYALVVEQKVSIKRIADEYEGTPDAWLWFPSIRKLYILDFKFGHYPVEAVENWQMISYTGGVLDMLHSGHCDGIQDQHIKVEMVIVQPRAWHIQGPVRSWEVTAANLRGHYNTLKTTWEQTQKPNPVTMAGAHCRDCKAASDCVTLRYKTAQKMDEVQTLNLHKLSPEDVAVQLKYLSDAVETLKSLHNALYDQSLEQIKQGVVIPGWSIGHGRGSAVWSKPDEEIFALGKALGVDLKKKAEPITPKQAIKLNVDESVIKLYSEYRKGQARLVKDSQTIAGSVFGKKTGK